MDNKIAKSDSKNNIIRSILCAPFARNLPAEEQKEVHNRLQFVRIKDKKVFEGGPLYSLLVNFENKYKGFMRL